MHIYIYIYTYNHVNKKTTAYTDAFCFDSQGIINKKNHLFHIEIYRFVLLFQMISKCTKELVHSTDGDSEFFDVILYREVTLQRIYL